MIDAPPPPPPSTPCTGLCKLGHDGLCLGCRRSGAEIAAWPHLPEPERLRLMRDILPRRQPVPTPSPQ